MSHSIPGEVLIACYIRADKCIITNDGSRTHKTVELGRNTCLDQVKGEWYG